MERDVRINEDTRDYLEKAYLKIQRQVEKLKQTWEEIPYKIRNELNNKFNENFAPEYCIRWLRQDFDELYRNSDDIFEEIKGELGEEISVMRKYENVIIVSPKISEEERNETLEKYKKMLEGFSKKEVKLEDLGEKKLAYEIQKQKTGFYAVYYFYAEPNDITELERNYRIDDNIMKFMTIRLEEEEEFSNEEEEEEEI